MKYNPPEYKKNTIRVSSRKPLSFMIELVGLVVVTHF